MLSSRCAASRYSRRAPPNWVRGRRGRGDGRRSQSTIWPTRPIADPIPAAATATASSDVGSSAVHSATTIPSPTTRPYFLTHGVSEWRDELPRQRCRGHDDAGEIWRRPSRNRGRRRWPRRGGCRRWIRVGGHGVGRQGWPPLANVGEHAATRVHVWLMPASAESERGFAAPPERDCKMADMARPRMRNGRRPCLSTTSADQVASARCPARRA